MYLEHKYLISILHNTESSEWASCVWSL